MRASIAVEPAVGQARVVRHHDARVMLARARRAFSPRDAARARVARSLLSPTRMRTLVAFSCLLGLALPLYACGGDDTTNPADASTDAKPDGTVDATTDAPSEASTDGQAPCASPNSCVAVSACSPDKGHLGVGACNSADLTCCTPPSACPAETFLCCTATAQFRPTCVNGALQCASGQTQCTTDGGTDGGGDAGDAGTDAPSDAPADG